MGQWDAETRENPKTLNPENTPTNTAATATALPRWLPSFRAAIETVTEGGLDIIVFADLLSEPLTYFAAFGRLARVQCVFWGNPVTSGQPTVDYFISGVRLEPRGMMEFRR